MIKVRIPQLLGLGALCGLGLFLSVSHADEVKPAVKKKIVETIQKSRKDIEVRGITPSPVKGLYRAQIVNGPTIYVTEDGRHFITGDLYEAQPGQLVNVTEQSRSGERKEALAKVDKSDTITFSPEGEVKAAVTVFTDIDCGYCRKLHQEVPKLNEMGVEVRYMAFPRAGVNSESYRKLATSFCADDPQETLTRYKNGESIPAKVCKDNPVAEQYQLGQEIGVTATPALVLESGELQLGYMEAEQLAQRLGL